MNIIINYIIENLMLFVFIILGTPFMPIFGMICHRREQKDNKEKILNAN